MYYRWVTTIADHYRIPIQRYRCPSCGKTFSLLPNFIAPWQRFHTGLREKALRLRFEDGLSWREIARQVGKRNDASWVNVQLWGRRALALLALLSEILLRELSRWRPGMDATWLWHRGLDGIPGQWLRVMVLTEILRDIVEKKSAPSGKAARPFMAFLNLYLNNRGLAVWL
ncbi:hypothetical protein SY88_20310 [Clostridiales bacterium PH28_bin88]|nr:hypothetical protein SY88_20310 [Clostridiales bacterium PH28_bin88]